MVITGRLLQQESRQYIGLDKVSKTTGLTVGKLVESHQREKETNAVRRK